MAATNPDHFPPGRHSCIEMLGHRQGNSRADLSPWSGDASRVSTLLAEGADANARNAEGMTALMAATWCGEGRGSVQIAWNLIEHGADLNASMVQGRTALMEPAGNGTWNSSISCWHRVQT